MSPLSLRSPGLLDKKLEEVENNPRKGGDKSDRFKFEANMSPSSVSPEGFFALGRDSLLYGFEERIAIAEYDGQSTQAERIAYLDAFISVLTTLPATNSQKDWLDMRIQTALAWIEAQEYRIIN